MSAPSKAKPRVGTLDAVEKVLYSSVTIDSTLRRLAAEISADYEGKEIIMVGMLRGAYMFFADLVRYIRLPVRVDFIACTSYSGAHTTGGVKLLKDVQLQVSGQHVIVVEDLIDTGTTLAWLRSHMSSKSVASFEICCLLNKKSRRKKKVTAKYIGFDDCPDAFIVGYGMDFNQYYRNLPFIGVLKEEMLPVVAEAEEESVEAAETATKSEEGSLEADETPEEDAIGEVVKETAKVEMFAESGETRLEATADVVTPDPAP